MTDYGLDGPGSNPGGTRFSARPDRPWGPPSLLYNGYRVFPGGRGGRGVGLTPHPHLVPWSRKSRAIPLLLYGPYGLYRASVPVQGCTLPYLLHPICTCVSCYGKYVSEYVLISPQFKEKDGWAIHLLTNGVMLN